MTLSHTSRAPMTAEAFVAWSEARADDSRNELLDGRVIAISAESARHVHLKTKAYEALAGQISAHGLACEAFADGMAVRVDDATVFEPDATVRCGKPFPDDGLLIEDPLIVVEVVSPSSQRIDVLVKLGRYFRNPSLAHYLIVVPEARLVIHHRRADDGAIETTSHDEGDIRLDPPGIELPIAALFPAVTPLE